MADTCIKCGRTESQVTADAQTLGLLQELESGVYTCCQISDWADEQWRAWFEAMEQDSKRVDDDMDICRQADTDTILVPVRFRRQQVPWYRNPGDRG